MSDEKGRAATLLRDGLAAFDANRIDAAETAFEATLAADPENTEAMYFLAVIAYQGGRSAVALDRATRAAAAHPNSPDILNLQGLALLALGRHDEACATLRRAAASDPQFADAENNLGAALEGAGRIEDAETAYRRATARRPDYAQAHCNLGRVLLALGRPKEAESACREAITHQTDLADAWLNLAVAQQRQGAVPMAEESVETALGNIPGNAALTRFRGALRHSRGDLGGAEAALRQALALQPDYAEAHDNLAGVLLDQGRIEEAEASFHRALAGDPNNSRAESNLLLCRNYYLSDRNALLAAHQAWASRHAATIAPMAQPRASARDRRLRIGYISGDFRRHSVAYFFEPLLEHHNGIRFESFCYANLENPDAVTARLQASCDHWRWVAGLDDERLAARIRQDEVDILVDLSGHTAHNRLTVFQHLPAPLQITWLGYPNTTGLTAMNYRITDAVADPEGADSLYTEQLYRLEDGFLCYRPPPDAPAVAEPVAPRPPTFGSFNNLRKLTPDTIALWSELLRQVPGSRLFLKTRPFADPATTARIADLFAAHGVARDRLELRGAVASPVEHLQGYAAIDVALDTIGYNGTTTTCEALWMGVPTVTLPGDRHAARVGASLLTQAGMTDCVASSPEDYIAIASRLAAEAAGRSRANIRRAVAASSLCDEAGFTHRMETAYEDMWRARTAGTL